MSYRRPRPPKHKLIRKRGISGLGLFAGNDIKRGDFIVEYWGPLLTDEEVDEKGGKYLFTVNDTPWTVDGSGRQNLARYINHSCKPNCEVEIDGKRIFIFAKRRIKTGEELNYDYGEEYFDDMIKPYGCRCGHHRKKTTPRSKSASRPRRANRR
jgi:hypothetical protein